MSGQELCAVSMEEILDVRDVKAALRNLHGFPMCMQQLLHNGRSLHDCHLMLKPIDRQMILLDPSTVAWQSNKYSDLLHAAGNGHLEMARLLLEAGADKEQHDDEGPTALLLAAEKGHVEIARLLLEAGASTRRKSSNGYTALMLAASNGHLEIAAALGSWC